MSKKRVVHQDYKCSECRDTGWVIVHRDGIRRSIRCPECGLEKIQARLLYDADIPAIYSGMDFKLFSKGDPSQSNAVARTVDFLNKYPRVRRGLLYVGPCGVGKTHLSVALLKALITEKQVRGLFVDEAELLSRLQHSYNPNTLETEERILSRLKNADLLVWDDLGTGRPTEWAKSKISEVINHRYTQCKWTVMSSNYPMPGKTSKWGSLSKSETLEERVGTRLFSRIMEMCEVVEVVGADYRIEIHKAGMDARDKNGSSEDYSSLITEAALICPKCSDGVITVIDSARSTVKGKGPVIDFSSTCSKCGDYSQGRMDLKTGKVEFS